MPLRQQIGNLFCAQLCFSRLRGRLAHSFREEYFHELDVTVPLAESLVAPITNRRYLNSFSEIFVDGEYRECFDNIPLPSRWLDIGSHAGFFSLYMLLRRRQAGLQDAVRALLIDGDPRTQKQTNRMIGANGVHEEFVYQTGAITSHAAPTVQFVQGECMESYMSSNIASGLTVPKITESEILKLMPPPFDLIKIDIEGAEYDFLTSYKTLLGCTKSLIIEWHGWHGGGGGKTQIIRCLRDIGFSICLEQDVVDTDRGDCGVLVCRIGNEA